MWPRPSIWSGSNENKNDGVAILINNPHILVEGSTVVREGRALLANLTFNGQAFNLLNIYGFNDKHDRYDFLEELQPHMLGRTPLIIGGDFNCVLTRKDRKRTGQDFKVDKTSLLLQRIVRDFKLVDCFRSMHPGEEGYTWVSDDSSKASRIDYFFTRDCALIDARLSPVFFSDHFLLSCTLSLPIGATTGRGLWKLNRSLLEDQALVGQYRERYREWQTLQDLYETRAQWWEMVKGRTRTFFRQAGKNKKKKEQRRMMGLQKRLHRYYILNQQGMDFNKEIREVKKEMSILAEIKSKGVILRSREREIEEGEKCTRYFFKNIISNPSLISELKADNGNIVSNIEEKIKVIEKFYEELYTENTVKENINETLEFLEKSLKETSFLEQDFTPLELFNSLKSFKRGKSPGSDGLPLEFYLTFWDILAPDLIILFTDFSKLDTLPDSFKTGIVTLLYKDKDKRDLKNWRPITLLNVDCKLFSKLLAARMRRVLGDLIHPDQACAVPGRRITDSLVLIRDTICFARDRNIRLIVLNLDFEKAFDRVSHQYLFQVLQKMGFPGRFVAWVGLLYRDISSRFMVNGFLTKAVKVNCGVRQGCPLSALLYVTCIEPLAQILRRDPLISGITIPGSGGQVGKCLLYMDDFNILCTDLLSVDRVFQLTDWFGKASGSKLNKEKTKAQFYGPWKNNEKIGLQFQVTQEEQKILGVKFDKNGDGKSNWTEITRRVKQRIGFWTMRNLTIEGKILIIKAVILPVFLLTSSVFIPPRRVILELQRDIFYFIWDSKWERIKREIMTKPKEKGGKGVPDLYLFLGSHYTSTHFKQAMNMSNNSKTNAMNRFWFGSYLRKLKLLKSDFRKPVAFNLPTAYAFIQKFLQHFKLEGEEIRILTNHRFIISFVQDREPVTPVRGLQFGDAITVWRNVGHPVLSNGLQDLSWMVAHEILPVRAVMHSRGMSTTFICPQPGCGAPESVRHLLWECSAARDLWAKAGSLQFPYLPAREVLDMQLMLYGVSHQKFGKKDFAEMWLTLATIKDAIWTSRNLLVSRRRQMPPVAVIRMAAARRQTIGAAGGTPRTQPQRRIACASMDEGAGATLTKVPAAAAWPSG